MRVLIKPNIMAQNPPEKHTITHPAFIDAICQVLSEYGCSIVIGESIAFYEPGLTEKALVTSGIKAVAEKYHAKTTGFEQVPLRKIEISGDDALKSMPALYVPEILFENDLIINACKLKSHQGWLRLSGAYFPE